jgi:hypothetical protein
MKPYGYTQQYPVLYLEEFHLKAPRWGDITSPAATQYQHRHIHFTVTQYYFQSPKGNHNH